MTLTQISAITKNAILATAIILTVSLVAFIAYQIWYAHYLASLPPPEVKPDTKFGILPAPDLPKSAVSSSNFSYSLDTTTGGLPKVGVDPGFDKIIKVYFIPKPVTTLLSADNSQVTASKLGITSPPEIIADNRYRFSDSGKTMVIEVDSGNFTYGLEATVSAKENGLDDDKRLADDFKNFLATRGLLKEELKQGRSNVSLLKFQGAQLVTTQNRTEAQAAQISLWPQDIDGKKIFTTQFNTSQVNAKVIKSAAELGNFLSINYTFWPVDQTTFATYPVKSQDAAFEDLKLGKGVVVVEPKKPQVSITALSLAYFLPDDYSPYLQPIYVFEGPSFVALVPAISEEFQSQAK